jgi:hypothetical protein
VRLFHHIGPSFGFWVCGLFCPPALCAPLSGCGFASGFGGVFSWHFFGIRFRMFLVKGSSKTPLKYVWKKQMSKTFPKQIVKNSDVSFSSTFFLIPFSGVSQLWEFNSTTKDVLQKKSCRKVFTKKSAKNPKPTFSRFFLITFLGISR